MTILVLEGMSADLAAHGRILETIPGVRTRLSADPSAAMAAFVQKPIDLAIVVDTIEGGALRWLKEAQVRSGRRDTPAIVIAANGDKEARRAAYEYGVYNCIEKPIDPSSYLCIARNALSIQVMRRNEATNSAAVAERYRALEAHLEEKDVQVIYCLLHAVNLVDATLSRRMVRVAAMAESIAHKVVPHEDARRFGIAARVYDIGMLTLTPQQRERRADLGGPDAGRVLGPHVERATEIFGNKPTGILDIAATVARSHHERFDGRGYPDALSGQQISIYAQIVAIAEAYVDVTTDGVPGPTRGQPLTAAQALAYIDRQTGTAYDPLAVEGLRAIVEAPAEGASATAT